MKARNRRIANTPTNDLSFQAVTDLQEWDQCNDKLKRWFEGILAFINFSLLHNEFWSQFYWLICLLFPTIRGQGFARVQLIIFPCQINKSCWISALLIHRDKRYSNVTSSGNQVLWKLRVFCFTKPEKNDLSLLQCHVRFTSLS